MGEVDEEKEWEGYYPNELDQEMKNYKFGDKIHPAGWNYNNNYSWNGEWWNTFGTEQTFAPPFDLHSPFEGPYYHINNEYWSNIWKSGGTGYWGYGGWDNYFNNAPLLA
jgi:hypothetical protein